MRTEASVEAGLDGVHVAADNLRRIDGDDVEAETEEGSDAHA
jgi:hypothetical protein